MEARSREAVEEVDISVRPAGCKRTLVASAAPSTAGYNEHQVVLRSDRTAADVAAVAEQDDKLYVVVVATVKKLDIVEEVSPPVLG